MVAAKVDSRADEMVDSMVDERVLRWGGTVVVWRAGQMDETMALLKDVTEAALWVALLGAKKAWPTAERKAAMRVLLMGAIRVDAKAELLAAKKAVQMAEKWVAVMVA